ncbi:MAG TPA: ATP-binding protein [bacterium]|nr:ATP-binding protein [bacterium]HOL35123.1 ATP-binding protein [bacterium]HPP07820.1 ATP-binding protein [bacterium]
MKLFFKTFVRAFLFIFGIALVVLFFFVHLLKTQYIENINNELGNVVSIIESAIQTPEIAKGLNDINNLISRIDEKTKIRITIISYNGNVLADSRRNPEEMENHSDRPEFKQAIVSGYGNAIRWSPTIDTYMIYCAKNINKYNIVVRASIPVDKAKITLINQKSRIVSIVLISLFSGIVFSFLLAKFATKPVYEILALTEEIKSKKNSDIIIDNRSDEIGKIMQNLTAFVNEIADFTKKEKMIAEELDKFTALVNFPIGIIDLNGDIVLSNSYFNEIFDISEAKGPWWEKIKNFDLLTIIRQTGEMKQTIERELKIKDKTFLCKSTPIEENEQVLIVLIDISMIKDIQERKKDFVTAVSHELKTPVTAIKGYIETIEEDIENPENKKFLNIIKYHSERLEKIVEDLITLAQLENEKPVVEFNKVNIVDITNNAISLFSKKALEKDITIEMLHNNVPEIYGDEFRLEQMFINLIDNAIRFTEKGKITISINHQKGAVIIEISDTGIGIPPQHIPKIFERFYVVDKARSRKTGGTGLGLSIVKHIVLLHNGTIDVKSTPGKGTSFIIQLPA